MPDPAPSPRPASRRSVVTALLAFASLVLTAALVIIALLYAGHRLQH